jgi:hypothetical protein
MIKYDLKCANGDEFEAWFGSMADYDSQAERGLIECPLCGDKHVTKAPMAPAVQTSRSKEARQARAIAMATAAKVREHIRDNYDYVGDKFAEEARKMHEGETETRAIWGEATPEDAQSLMEEGAPVAPLPPALAPDAPNKKLN